MSTTYLVFDYQLRQLAVLKEISAQLAQKAKAREMFQREARMLKSLQHPGIPRFYDFFLTSERYSLVVEMIHGHNLAQLQAANAVQAVEWLIEVSKILDYLQQRNPSVIHRDIKPANIMLRYYPRQIVLIDFGAVKEATTPPGTRIATPGYGAPEQQKGVPCTQSDFFALGSTLVYLLTGLSPNQLYLPLQGKFEGLQAAGIPSVLVDVIHTLTAFNPGDRPQTASEVTALLEKSLDAFV